MYFLNTPVLAEFKAYATRVAASEACTREYPDTTVTYRRMSFDELLKAFPFIRSVDAEHTVDWSEPVFHDAGSFLECIPAGWLQPWFLETMLISLADAIRKDRMDPRKIYLNDAKEKYGSLRMDFSTPVTEGHAFSNMCLAWEELAGYFCCMCGKPHVSISRGWICPYCKDCWDDTYGEFKEVPLENLKIVSWKDGEQFERIIDLKPLYDRVVSVWEDNNVK
jgi:hypothetical protein